MAGLIYCITNQINGKKYVGQTIRGSWLIRWRHHLRSVRDGSTLPIHNAIRKYGEGSFKVRVLCECRTQDRLNEMEELHANRLDSFSPDGYNLRAGNQFRKSRRLCSVGGCGKAHLAKGYCKYHWGTQYQEGIKNGDIYRDRCVVSDCMRPATSHRHCMNHWNRIKSHGSVDGYTPHIPNEYKVSRLVAHRMYVLDGMSTTGMSKALGYSITTICSILRSYSIPIRPCGRVRKVDTPCSVVGCTELCRIKGMCLRHYKSSWAGYKVQIGVK